MSCWLFCPHTPSFIYPLSLPVLSGFLLFHLATGTPTLPQRPPRTGRLCQLSGCAEGRRGKCVPPLNTPPFTAARSTGLPGGRGKRSRLQPEPAAATWVGRGGTGAEKAGPGEGGGAGSWELGSGGARGTLENRETHKMIQGSRWRSLEPASCPILCSHPHPRET